MPRDSEDLDPRPRLGAWGASGALLSVYCAAHLFNNLAIAGGRLEAGLERLHGASAGLVEPLLVRSWIVLAAFLLVRRWLLRRGPADLGWRRDALLPALRTTVLCWAALQIGLLAVVGWSEASLAPHPMWARRGALAVIGGVLAQALGHALAEETIFRGHFLELVRRREAARGPWRSAVCAAVASSLLFGLAHLGVRVLVHEVRGLELVQEQGHFFLAGLAFAALYLATGNLLTTAALHALVNDPAPLVKASGTTVNGVLLVVLGGLVLVRAARFVGERWTASAPARVPTPVSASRVVGRPSVPAIAEEVSPALPHPEEAPEEAEEWSSAEDRTG